MAIKRIKINGTSVDINDARDVVIGDGVENIVTLTAAQYDALATKDEHTAYIVTDRGVSTSEAGQKELVSNKVTSLSSSSTDEQYPSAKCVYDIVGDIETLLAAL